MTRGSEWSRPLAAAAAAALFAVGATFWLRAAESAKLSRLRTDAAIKERGFAGRIAEMSEFEDKKVEALRRDVIQARLHLAPGGAWEHLTKRLGSNWAAETGSKEDGNGYSIQTGTFRLLSRAVGDWPEIVDVVKDLEAIPGVGIAEFQMKSSGRGVHRSLETARIVVVVQGIRGVSSDESIP